MLVQFRDLSAVTSFAFLLHLCDSKIPKYLDKYPHIEISTDRENALERRERANQLFLILFIETHINQ